MPATVNGSPRMSTPDRSGDNRPSVRVGCDDERVERDPPVPTSSAPSVAQPHEPLRFSTRCATAYHRARDRTRRLLNAAVLDEVPARDGHVIDAAYREPFDVLLSSPKFEYGDAVVLTLSLHAHASAGQGMSILLSPSRSVLRRGEGER